MESEPRRPWWKTAYWLAFLGFIAIGGFFLLTEHAAHLFGALPFLLLLACPLMHLFGHGHGGHGGTNDQRADQAHRH